MPTEGVYRTEGRVTATAFPLTSTDVPVSPPREARSTDVAVGRITYTTQMLIGAILMTATIIGAVYGLTGGIRESQLRTESDMRDLRTRMEYQQRVNEADARAQGVVFDNMKTTVEQLRAQVQLLQLQYAEINKQIRQR
jgi:uncharacterized protein HemX